MDRRKIKTDSALVFDFDGTMCRLFKNYDLKQTTELLSVKMKDFNIEFSIENDAFDVFSEIIAQTESNASMRDKALIAADLILTNAEKEAVLVGERVNGVETVIPQLMNAGYPVGIATNNSAECVRLFLRKYCPGIEVPVFGRVGNKPERMKPDAWSILETLQCLNCESSNAVLIGDTQRDYYGAFNAGCGFIGMASTERKREKLLQVMKEEDMVSNFYELLHFLQSS